MAFAVRQANFERFEGLPVQQVLNRFRVHTMKASTSSGVPQIPRINKTAPPDDAAGRGAICSPKSQAVSYSFFVLSPGSGTGYLPLGSLASGAAESIASLSIVGANS